MVPSTAKTTGRQPTGRSPRAAGAPRPSGRTATRRATRHVPKKAVSTSKLLRAGKSQKTMTPITGAAIRKISMDQPGKRRESLSINGLGGVSKRFDS